MRPQMSIHKAYPSGYGIDPSRPTLSLQSHRVLWISIRRYERAPGDGRVAAKGFGLTIAPPTIHPPATPDEPLPRNSLASMAAVRRQRRQLSADLGRAQQHDDSGRAAARPTTYNHHHPLHVLTDVHANTPAASSTMSTSSTKASSTTRARRPASAAPTVPGYHRLTVDAKTLRSTRACDESRTAGDWRISYTAAAPNQRRWARRSRTTTRPQTSPRGTTSPTR